MIKVKEYKAILEDFDRCVGCYACEIACKKENGLPEEETFIKVSEIGPEKVDGKLAMEFIISIARDCSFCKERLEKGLEPACVSECPTQALIYCDLYELLKDIKNSRIQMLRGK